MIPNISDYQQAKHLRQLLKFHFDDITGCAVSFSRFASRLFVCRIKSFSETNAAKFANKKALQTHGPRSEEKLFRVRPYLAEERETMKRAARYLDLFCHIVFMPDL